MGKFLYELHCHTSESSACACSGGAALAESYASMGYSGFVVSDHFFNGNSCACYSQDLTWEEKVDVLCDGYEKAAERGKQLGLNVIFGFEFSCYGNDYITIGLDKQWLLENPDVMSWDLKLALTNMRKAGAYIIHAHPFREEAYIEMIRLLPRSVDAVEIFNAGNRQQIYNDRALWYAENYGLPKVVGTDLHNSEIPADHRTAVAFEQNPADTKDLIRMLGEGTFTLKYTVH